MFCSWSGLPTDNSTGEGESTELKFIKAGLAEVVEHIFENIQLLNLEGEIVLVDDNLSFVEGCSKMTGGP